MADLSHFTRDHSEQASWLHLENPVDGTPLYADDETKEKPMRISLVGRDSKAYQTRRHKLSNTRLKKVGRTGSLTTGQTSESIEEDATGLLVSATTGWENIVLEGEEVVFSRANARDLYEKLPWVREQVDEFVANRANFLGE